jgi:hypothetical protein
MRFFFLLLLPANKIDRIQNVATKNPFPGKREKKKKKKKKTKRTRTHTFTNTHIDILNQSKYLEFVSISINMSVPVAKSKFSMTCQKEGRYSNVFISVLRKFFHMRLF